MFGVIYPHSMSLLRQEAACSLRCAALRLCVLLTACVSHCLVCRLLTLLTCCSEHEQEFVHVPRARASDVSAWVESVKTLGDLGVRVAVADVSALCHEAVHGSHTEDGLKLDVSGRSIVVA